MRGKVHLQSVGRRAGDHLACFSFVICLVLLAFLMLITHRLAEPVLLPYGTSGPRPFSYPISQPIKKQSFLEQIKQVEGMWSSVGTAVSDNCRFERGSGFIQGWQANHLRLCSPEFAHPRSAHTRSLNSTIDCFVIPNLDGRAKREKQIYYHACQTTDSEVRWSAHSEYFQLRTACSAEMTSYLQSAHIDSNYRFETEPMARDFVDNVQRYDCAEWRRGTAFFLRRWDAHNFYHSMEDFVTSFMLFATLRVDVEAENVSVVVVDKFGQGARNFNGPMFAKLFSNQNRVEFASLQSRNQTQCFRKTIHSIFGALSLLSYRGFAISPDTLSCRSSILSAFSQYALRRFLGASSFEMVSAKMQKTPITLSLVYIARRSKSPRALSNAAELMRFLSEDVLSALAANEIRWTLKRVLLEEMHIAHQLEVIAAADILLGVHGAGLTHVMFVPQREDGGAHLIELFCGNRGSVNTHYRLIAAWKGVGYSSLSLGRCRVAQSQLQQLRKMLLDAAHGIVDFRMGAFQVMNQIRTSANKIGFGTDQQN